jgi:hypothetical protein
MADKGKTYTQTDMVIIYRVMPERVAEMIAGLIFIHPAIF